MILHILSSSLHSVRFVEYLKQNFDCKNQKFVYVRPSVCIYGLSNVGAEHIHTKFARAKLALYMNLAEKIVLHGLWRHEVINLLMQQRWLLPRCFWVLWGGDFLHWRKYSAEHDYILRRVGYFIPIVPEDISDILEQYGECAAKVHPISCFYVSNLFTDEFKAPQNRAKKKILVGNSGDALNCHLEILDNLQKFAKEDIELFCPLSYDCAANYKEQVINKGKELFGGKFKPLVELLPREQYLEILRDIDIAVFAHKNQQAYGNIVQTCGLGKKVFLRRTSVYRTMTKLGVSVFDFEKGLDLEPLSEHLARKNWEIIKNHFSAENLKSEITELFFS